MSRYIVSLKNVTDCIKFNNFLKCHNINYKYLDDLNYYIIYTTNICSKCISNFDYIDIIEEDTILPIDDDLDKPCSKCSLDLEDFSPLSNNKNPCNWGVDKIKSSYFWNQGFTGQNVNVAIMDTGIYSHQYLDIKGGVSIGGNITPYDDHGTLVAGIIKTSPDSNQMTGVAYGCNLYDVNIVDDITDPSKKGEFRLWTLIDGIQWCIDNNIHIINLSLGIDSISVSKNTNKLFLDAILKATDKGIIVVAASGNSNKPYLELPAYYPQVFSIGATDENNNRWVDIKSKEGSNYGLNLNFVAPGVNLISTSFDDGYCVATGTSMAVPHVVGLIALILSKFPNLNRRQLRSILERNALPLPPGSVYNFEYGYGLVQTTR